MMLKQSEKALIRAVIAKIHELRAAGDVTADMVTGMIEVNGGNFYALSKKGVNVLWRVSPRLPKGSMSVAGIVK